jgi:hypothetical protein
LEVLFAQWVPVDEVVAVEDVVQVVTVPNRQACTQARGRMEDQMQQAERTRVMEENPSRRRTRFAGEMPSSKGRRMLQE